MTLPLSSVTVTVPALFVAVSAMSALPGVATVAVIVVRVPVATTASAVVIVSVDATLVQPVYHGALPVAASQRASAFLFSALSHSEDWPRPSVEGTDSSVAGAAGTSPLRPLPPTCKYCSAGRLASDG